MNRSRIRRLRSRSCAGDTSGSASAGYTNRANSANYQARSEHAGRSATASDRDAFNSFQARGFELRVEEPDR